MSINVRESIDALFFSLTERFAKFWNGEIPSSEINMKKAEDKDKTLVVNILTKSFDTNQSVNYIVKQDNNRVRRIRALMGYSYEVCRSFGDVFLSDDNNACALVLYPDKKKMTLMSALLDARLIFQCIGIENVGKAIAREKLLKKVRGNELVSSLWFIGVDPQNQHKGSGSKLLSSIIEYSHQHGRSVSLETSNKSNLPWYEKFGFKIYAEEDLGHTLYFLKRETEK